MTDTTAQTLASSEPLWLRILFVLLFYLVFGLVDLLILGGLIVQLLHLILTGRPHPELARFGRGLGRYVGQVVAYITWASDTKPYPFREWPGEGPDRERGCD